MKNAYIVGEGVYLRPLEISDVTDKYISWMNDRTIAENLPSATFPVHRHDIEAYVESEVRNKDTIFLAIIEIASESHIGNVKLGPIRWVDKNAEYSRLLGDPSARGKGYGKEVAKLVLDIAFKRLNLHKVYASCLVSNKAAINSNISIGMQEEGIIKERRYLSGKYEDIIYLGMNKAKYLEKYGY